MKFLADSMTLLCKPGEVIQVEVYPQGKSHGIHYNLAGQSGFIPSGESLRFSFSDKKENRQQLLLMNLDFSEATEYEVRVLGAEGSAASYTVKHSGLSPGGSLAFGLEGDPDTDY